MRNLFFILFILTSSQILAQTSNDSFNSSLESVTDLSSNDLIKLESILTDLCSDCELVFNTDNSKSVILKMNTPFDLYDFLLEANNQNLFVAHISSNFSHTKLSDEDAYTQKQFTLSEQKKKFKENRPNEYNNLLKSNKANKSDEK